MILGQCPGQDGTGSETPICPTVPSLRDRETGQGRILPSLLPHQALWEWDAETGMRVQVAIRTMEVNGDIL